MNTTTEEKIETLKKVREEYRMSSLADAKQQLLDLHFETPEEMTERTTGLKQMKLFEDNDFVAPKHSLSDEITYTGTGCRKVPTSAACFKAMCKLTKLR